jgi:hypothetical protein
MFPIQFLMFSKCHFIVFDVKHQAKGGTTYHHFDISSFIEEIGCAAQLCRVYMTTLDQCNHSQCMSLLFDTIEEDRSTEFLDKLFVDDNRTIKNIMVDFSQEQTLALLIHLKADGETRD